MSKSTAKGFELVKEYIGSATIHGVARTVTSGSQRRLAWLIILGVSLIFLVVFAGIQFYDLSKFRTLSRTTIVFHEDEISFPAVTICNLNWVSSKIRHCVPGADLVRLFYELSEVSIHVSEEELARGNISLPPIPKHVTGGQFAQCMKDYSHAIDESMEYCTWEGKRKNCTDIFKQQMTEIGYCFTFNDDNKWKARAHGSNSGLRVFFDSRNRDAFFSPTKQSGIKVVVHEPGVTPLPSVRGFLVAPGLSAEAVLSKTERISLGWPYGNCLETTDKNFRNPLKLFNRYSQSSCYAECYLQHQYDVCGCWHIMAQSQTIRTNGSINWCSPVKIKECILPDLRNTPRSGYGCSCKESCRESLYDWSISYGGFCSEFIAQFLAKVKREDITEGLRDRIDLRIYYSKLSETIVEEIPESGVSEVLGQLGGQMGLFLGASLLSIVEIIEVIILICIRHKTMKVKLQQLNGNHLEDKKHVEQQ